MKRLYRLLLRIYPAGFRGEYATELERQFADEYREAGSRGERIRLSTRAIADLLTTAPPEIAREVKQDLRYALRIYRARSVATSLALVALALAIGATTGIFSVLNAVLIRSLPFREPDRLVATKLVPVTVFGREAVDSWRQASPYLEDAALYSSQPMNLQIGRESYRATVAETSANFLELLGTQTIVGRGFSSNEDSVRLSSVAVLGYGLWQRAFGGDPNAIGSTVRVNGVDLTVIGVAPPSFDFPDRTALWAPTVYDHLPSVAWVTMAIGRLKEGVRFEDAFALHQAEIQRALPGQRAIARRDNGLIRLQDRLAGPVRAASMVLMGMMVFVLLIACASLAHLLLSRITERRQELAIRVALGASRPRLTRQLITEAAVLTFAAAAAGMVVAHWTARLAAIVQPAQLASRQYTVLDWRVMAFALGVAAATSILFGVLPASLVGGMQPAQDMIRSQPGQRGGASGRMRTVLIALQAALTVTLTAGAFTMGRSFLKLMGIDLGYQTAHVLTMSVSLPNSVGALAPFTHQALDRLRALPGVESAGAASYLPLVDSLMQEGTFFRFNKSEQKRRSRIMTVSPGFFRTMSTPLVEGREFTDSDRSASEPVAIVTEDFQRMYRDRRLVGSKILLEPALHWVTIVGVVRSQRFLGPESTPWQVIYRPIDQYEQWMATFTAKVRGDPKQYLAACRDALQSVNPKIPVFDVTTLDQRLRDTVARPRFYTTTILFFAAFSLLVAAIGAYGAACHSVSQRRHEIGIRIALGGPPGRVQALVFRQSMIPVFGGATVGLIAAAWVGRFLDHWIASAQTGLPISAGAGLVVLIATASAIWIATSSIVRVDPTVSIRME